MRVGMGIWIWSLELGFVGEGEGSLGGGLQSGSFPSPPLFLGQVMEMRIPNLPILPSRLDNGVQSRKDTFLPRILPR